MPFCRYCRQDTSSIDGGICSVCHKPRLSSLEPPTGVDSTYPNFSTPTSPLPSPVVPSSASHQNFLTPTSPLPSPVVPSSASHRIFSTPTSPFPSPVTSTHPASLSLSVLLVLPEKRILLNIYISTMQEKNEGVFHPSEPLHQLWWAFEYFHARFAKKVAIEIVSTLAPIGVSTGLGAAAGGGPGALMALGGAMTTEMISSSAKAINIKMKRQSEMDKGFKEFFSASSLGQKNEINPYAKLTRIMSPSIGAVPGMARSSIGFGEIFAAKKISAQSPSSRPPAQIEGNSSREPLHNQQPSARQSMVQIPYDSRENDLNEMFIWHGYYIIYNADNHLSDETKALRDALGFDIYYKPPKSGSLNKYVLNYSFFLNYIKKLDGLGTREYQQDANWMRDFNTIKDNTFKALDYFWQMSRTWPMLDYLFFNYGFYKFFTDFSEHTVQDHEHKVNKIFYASRLYFLSKNFYLEHFFRIILPTYELILHAHRHDAMLNIPGNLLDKLAVVLKIKYNKSQLPQTSGFFSKIQSAIESSQSPRNFAKNTGIKKNIVPFLTLIKGYADKIKGIDSIDQLSQLNRLVNFFHYSTQTEIMLEASTPLSPLGNSVYVKLRDCADSNFQTIINPYLRSFFQTERIEFIKDPKLKRELQKVKTFFYHKMRELVVSGNVTEAWLNIGHIDIVINLFDEWIAEYENGVIYSDVADFSMGVLNGMATMFAVYALSYLIESKALAHITHKVPWHFREGLRFLLHTVGGARIALGTANYMYQIFMRTHSNILDLIGAGFWSSGWTNAAFIGPNLFNFTTSIVLQILKTALYDDMDRECLKCVDRLVQTISSTGMTPTPTPNIASPHSSSSSSGSSSSFSAIHNDSVSSPSTENQQQVDMLFCRVFMYQCIAENIKRSFGTSPSGSTFVAGEALKSPIADELDALDRHLTQAVSLLKKCNTANISTAKFYQDYAKIYLFFAESILHYINIKKLFPSITSKKSTQLNDNDLDQIKAIIDYFNAFYMSLDGAINIVFIVQDWDVVLKADERLEIVSALNNVIYSLHKKTKDYFSKIVYDLATWVKQLVQNYKPNFAFIRQYQTLSGKTTQENKAIVTSYQNTVNQCNLISVALSQQIFRNNQRSFDSTEQQNDIQVLKAKEEQYAVQLKLDLALTKPFSILTEEEKLILYRDFGRVLRHLFQNVPTPSELMELGQELENLIANIHKSTQDDDSHIKEFINKQFEYTRAVLLKENFVYYSRVYQFLCERLRIEFLSNSHIYLEQMERELRSQPIESVTQEPNRTAPPTATEVKMQELLRQLKSEYESFLGASVSTMNMIHQDVVPVPHSSAVGSCMHENAIPIPSGMSAASHQTRYCPDCDKTF